MNTSIYKLTAIAFCVSFIIPLGLNAKKISKSLPEFDKVIVSPDINLVLKKSDAENIQIDFENIDSTKINIEVKHGTLMIYLDDGKYWIKNETIRENGKKHKRGKYPNANINAYVSYKALRALTVRGDQKVLCEDALENNKVKVKVYGNASVTLQKINSRKSITKVYGDNKVIFNSGNIGKLNCRIYGDNRLLAGNVTANKVKCCTLGDGFFEFNCSDKISIIALGDNEIISNGQKRIRKRLVLGDNAISYVD